MSKKDTSTLIENCQQRINVTEYGADPTGKKDSTRAIWKAFEAAKKYSDGYVVVDFPNGIYQLQKSAAEKRAYHTSNTNSIEYPIKHITLLLEDQEKVILNGNGSLFIIHGDCMALGIIRSKEIYLYDFSWDFAIPTTVEMTVKATGKDNHEQYTDFHIPDCFLHSVDENQRDVYWYGEVDPTTGKHYWVDKNHKNAWTLVGYHPESNITRRYSLELGPFSERRTKVVKLSDSTLRVFYGDNRPLLHQKGFVFEFCSTPRRETAGAFIWESEDTIIEKVNVHYMHAFGWLTQMSHNVSYYNCNFTARKGSERYTSSYADLIHVSGASGHIHIEGCYFNHAHDDPINIHGTFTRVEEVIDNYTMKLQYIQAQQGGFPQYYIGDEVIFYRRDKLVHGNDKGKSYFVTAVSNPGENGNDLRTMTVTFNQPLPNDIGNQLNGEPLFVAENITYTPTVHIKNNRFETISTRGILCTTRKKVLIENNLFRHMAMDAIYISNDARYWYESGPVRDVTIRANVFYVTKVGNAKWRNAAVRIEPITLEGKLPPNTNAIHRNICIKDNSFYMEHESVLSAKSVSNLTFTRNKIFKYQPDGMAIEPKENDPNKDKVVSKSTFELVRCQEVIIYNNMFDDNYQATLSYSLMSPEHMKKVDLKNIEEK
ncbi:right-handed parallel beta-helix repeat-containing protein [Virgibacillus pantothenticus]|uniref:right-handed parallel beta-helix repeat-containing protein n=1 Tax=Virgibacillus pantothenticus TaxID=1473 RepID=UPI00098480B0|nr:right-handed parallel beta-helix repeat-containing protein [Virgibacillus pantothenticus]